MAFDALDVRRHVIHLVFGEVLPVFGIKVASLAVEMFGIVLLVQLHRFQGVEQVLAVLLGALELSVLIWHMRCTLGGGVLIARI